MFSVWIQNPDHGFKHTHPSGSFVFRIIENTSEAGKIIYKQRVGEKLFEVLRKSGRGNLEFKKVLLAVPPLLLQRIAKLLVLITFCQKTCKLEPT